MTYMGPGRKLKKKRAKTKKGSVYVRLSEDLHVKLIDLCESKGVSIAGFVRDFIKEEVSKYEAKEIMRKDKVKERFRNPLR